MTKRFFLLIATLFFVLDAQTPPATPPAKKAAPPVKKVTAMPPVQKAEPKQQVLVELTVEQIVQLVQAGLPEDLIIAKIRKNGKAFDLSTEQLLQLKKAGASDNIIRVLMDPQAQPVATLPAPATIPDQLPESTNKSATVARFGQTQTVKVRDGERVRLLLSDDISSATANTGDQINFTVGENVKVGDIVVISKGASGVGTIAEAKKKGMLGRGGKLTMHMEYVKSVDNQNIRVRASASREGDHKTGKTVAVFVIAGPFAALVKGKDVVSPRGTEYSAYIDEEKEIIVNK